MVMPPCPAADHDGIPLMPVPLLHALNAPQQVLRSFFSDHACGPHACRHFVPCLPALAVRHAGSAMAADQLPRPCRP
ncbi:hypothetical protein A9J41_02675 [Laribacter hongkongensis]|nr:hypothetical protein [Laribacter hongkongensis]